MTLIAKLFGFLVLVWVLAFAIANPHTVAMNFWPLPYELSAPLSVLVVFLLAVGYVFGACAGYCRGRSNKTKTGLPQ